MNILAVCGSPRKGNTEWILRRLLEAVAANDVETELVLLRKQDIENCDGCLRCEDRGTGGVGVCHIKDDMQEIYPRLLQADALVFGTPVYFDMVSGLLKNFIDRTNPIWPKMEGKSFAGVAVAEEGIGKAIDNLRTFSSVCGMSWIGYVSALAKEREQVSKDRAVYSRIKTLGKKIAADLT
jgi:multimeric flavodoxin WrbA